MPGCVGPVSPLVGHGSCQGCGVTESNAYPSVVIVVTGANGLVVAHLRGACRQGALTVRALVRRAGTAPALARVQEWVGHFFDPGVAGAVAGWRECRGDDGSSDGGGPADPAWRSRLKARPCWPGRPVTQACKRLVHISTAGVYDRSPGAGDVDETSRPVGDHADAYAVTKRTPTPQLAQVEGITRVLLRPPAVLGPGASSIWNSVRPAMIRTDEMARDAIPEQSFPWVHVDDLAAFAADLACGRIPSSSDPERGPVPRGCTVVNVAAGTATTRDYHQTVTAALGVQARLGRRSGVDRTDRGRTSSQLGLGPDCEPAPSASGDSRKDSPRKRLADYIN